VTDRLADLLLTPSRDGDENLLREGVEKERIHLVGNIMIDSLLRQLPVAAFERLRGRVPVEKGAYAVLTLHRPSNVDDEPTFRRILAALKAIAAQMPIVFPVHPRTRTRLSAFGLNSDLSGFVLTEPMGYIDFLTLTSNARIILTDSGGLQEESTALGIPCLTMRENTERPVTITHGTNRLVGTQTKDILEGFQAALNGSVAPRRPELWDGRTAERIVAVLRNFLVSGPAV
jgi:UDP-N-acetylglucosamine 2-epimerase (non-hydrolysing)